MLVFILITIMDDIPSICLVSTMAIMFLSFSITRIDFYLVVTLLFAMVTQEFTVITVFYKVKRKGVKSDRVKSFNHSQSWQIFKVFKGKYCR